ncbi:hypothetical protein F511_31901 [Dorcoceras hygrometricum]|uniref:Uncharacterized protein n=1 Tax=Dorcoceras hygrometricum TaxID=472368 RepID=A0A2Z7BE39_9LAMI|nr:hypothetical protein F511_31901 [Dorcoceras hygrometricum]
MSTGYTKRCSLRLIHYLATGCPASCNDMFAADCPVVGREKLVTGYSKLATGCTKLATGFPNDWVDQTMSYPLIQTTLFAMHPRLVEYNAEALD